MKFGVRKPSLKRRISARTSPKRFIRHNLGIKAPKGFGMITNPKKAMYNKVYNKTSFSADDLLKISLAHHCGICGKTLRSDRTKLAGKCSQCLKKGF